MALAAGVGACVVFVLMANLPTRLWMPVEVATLAYLAETTLQNISSGEKFKVRYCSDQIYHRFHIVQFMMYSVQ